MFEFLQVAIEAKNLYVGALPTWVQIWMKVMTFVFSCGIFFVLHHKQARWFALSVVGSVLAALVWGGFFGFDRFWAIWHILFYTPFLVYAYRTKDQWLESQVFSVWLRIACSIMIISLAFDWFDLIRFALS